VYYEASALLPMAIRVILQLYKQGDLDPNKRIAEQLEQDVLRNAWLSVARDYNRLQATQRL